MQAYAKAQRQAQSAQLHLVQQQSSTAAATGSASIDPCSVIVDELLGRLADLVAERIDARLGALTQPDPDEWLDTRRAAEYVGIHRDTIRDLPLPVISQVSRRPRAASFTSAAAISTAGVGQPVPLSGQQHERRQRWAQTAAGGAQHLPSDDGRARGRIQGHGGHPALAHGRRRGHRRPSRSRRTIRTPQPR